MSNAKVTEYPFLGEKQLRTISHLKTRSAQQIIQKLQKLQSDKSDDEFTPPMLIIENSDGIFEAKFYENDINYVEKFESETELNSFLLSKNIELDDSSPRIGVVRIKLV